MPVVGTQQSPIKIVTRKSILASFPPDYFAIDYPDRPFAGTFEHENFVFAKPVPSITFRGEKWLLHKIHIHRPAEHRIDESAPADFECHLIHLRQKDPGERSEKLVIGVFFEIDEKAVPLSSFAEIDRVLGQKLEADQGVTPPRPGKAGWAYADEVPTLKVNPTHFLPEKRQDWQNWFHYEGSLTTGTYSEDVSWFVLPKEVRVLSADVLYLSTQTEHEPREVHAIDRRFVLRSFGPAVLLPPQ
jgi:carbonic anhydrase